VGDRYNLERFVVAQDTDDTYDHADLELRQGRKTSHWMWFVFPQLAGLGRSETSRKFALPSLAEARAYLRHPVLRPRLIECARILDTTSNKDAVQIFGNVDAQKLHSSLTLFRRADPDERLFQRLLDRYFDGVPDPTTDGLIADHRGA
jgi:uncharacterized protein (DUF1810 family)